MAMQYAVPQNIFMPDRIIGPLTLGQFLYLAGAAGIDLLLWFAIGTANLTLFSTLALPIAGLGAALAFVKIQNLPFNKFVQAYLIYALRPKKRVFGRVPELEKPVVAAPKIEAKPTEIIRPGAYEIRSKIRDLSNILDTYGWSAVKEKRPEIAAEEVKLVVPEAKLTPVGKIPGPPPTEETTAFAFLPEQRQKEELEKAPPTPPPAVPPPEATPPGESPMPY